MKFRVRLDDDLVRTAQDYCGEKDLSLLVSKALNALILLKRPDESAPTKPGGQTSSPARRLKRPPRQSRFPMP